MQKFLWKIMKIIIPLLGICGFNYMLSIIYDNSIITNNVFINFVLFIVLLYVYEKEIFNKNPKKKYVIFSTIFSIFLSIITILGLELESTSNIVWTIENFVNCILLSIVVFPIVFIIIKYIEEHQFNEKQIKIKHLSVITFFVILFFTFLVWLALYPGVYGYDSIIQIDRVFNKCMDTHYSVLFCYILGGFTKLGDIVFNSYQTGIGIYTFLQMIIMTLISTKIVMKVYNWTKNNVIYIISLIFYCVFIFYKLMIVSCAQDVLFGGFFALLIMQLMDIVLDQEKWMTHKRNYILFGIYTLMICLLRNNGFYALIFVIPFLIILLKGKKKINVISVFVISLVVYKIITGPIYDAMGVIKNNDGIKEALSIPTQQLARVYTYHKKSFKEEDIEQLKKYYIDIDILKQYKYSPSISDIQKGQVNTENVKNDLLGYTKFYIKIGLRDKRDYIEAFLLNNLGLWFSDKRYYDGRMFHPLIEYNMTPVNEYINTGYIAVDRNSLFPAYEKKLNSIVNENKWQEIPIYSTFCTLGFYFVFNVFALGIIIMRKKWDLLLPLSLIIGLYITVFLAPVSLFRYAFPIIICTPIILMIIMKKDLGKCNERRMIENG